MKYYFCSKFTYLDLKKYINNISALQFFQIFRFGTLFLISIFFAKSSLSQTAIGDYEFFIFLAGAVSFFWVSGIIQALLPLHGDEKDNPGSPILFNAFILLCIFSIIIAGIVAVLGNNISELAGKEEGIPFLKYLILFILFANPSFLIEYIYLLKNKTTRIFAFGIISFTLQLIFVVTPILHF